MLQNRFRILTSFVNKDYVIRKYFYWKILNTCFKDYDHIWQVMCIVFPFWMLSRKDYEMLLLSGLVSDKVCIPLFIRPLHISLSIYYVSLLCQVLGMLANKPGIVPLLWEYMWLYDYEGSGILCIASHPVIDRWTGAIL